MSNEELDLAAKKLWDDFKKAKAVDNEPSYIVYGPNDYSQFFTGPKIEEDISESEKEAKMKIVGLCGYSKVGKDALSPVGWCRIAFADQLKYELDSKLGVDCYKHKEAARPLMVAYGEYMRSVDPLYWVNYVKRLIVETGEDCKGIVIPDVRYPNEADMIHEMGGCVIRIHRDGVGPANEIEEKTISDVDVDAELYNTASIELGRQIILDIVDDFYDSKSPFFRIRKTARL